ncbi:RNA-binding protein 1 [Carabus blaptoides fortunei]
MRTSANDYFVRQRTDGAASTECRGIVNGICLVKCMSETWNLKILETLKMQFVDWMGHGVAVQEYVLRCHQAGHAEAAALGDVVVPRPDIQGHVHHAVHVRHAPGLVRVTDAAGPIRETAVK